MFPGMAMQNSQRKIYMSKESALLMTHDKRPPALLISSRCNDDTGSQKQAHKRDLEGACSHLDSRDGFHKTGSLGSRADDIPLPGIPLLRRLQAPLGCPRSPSPHSRPWLLALSTWWALSHVACRHTPISSPVRQSLTCKILPAYFRTIIVIILTLL